MSTNELTDDQKFKKLCNLANELGIHIEYYGSWTFLSIGENEYELNCVNSFPPKNNFKMEKIKYD